MNNRILANIKSVLNRTLPKGGKAILFGSQARGDARTDSDWDILVVVEKEKILAEDYDTITYPLTKLGWELGVDINPILYTRKEWEAYHFTPFYYNVKNDGIAIA